MLKGPTSFNWKGFQVAIPNPLDKITPSEWENILNLSLDAGKKPNIKVYKPEEYIEKSLNGLHPKLFEKADDTCTAITAVTMPNDWNGELPSGCDPYRNVNVALPRMREYEIRKKMKISLSNKLKYQTYFYLLILGMIGFISSFIFGFCKLCIFIVNPFIGLSLFYILLLSVLLILFGGSIIGLSIVRIQITQDKIEKYKNDISDARCELYKEIDDKNLTEEECKAKLKLKEIETTMGQEFAKEYQRIKNL